MFIHRNSLFNLCDFAYTSKEDQWAPFQVLSELAEPENIPEGSVIYATPWGILKFLHEIHPRIKNRYILLTYCYGPVFDVEKYINDPKIIHWFGQANSNAITFEKFTLMPLGIFATNILFEDRINTIKLLKKARELPKNNLLYMNIFLHKGQDNERDLAYALYNGKPYCKTVNLTPTWRMPFSEYIMEVGGSKFTVSPKGDMHDTYRHWESMIVGSIPVMLKGPLDKIFEDMPALIVEDYEEATESMMIKTYEEMKNKTYNMRKLYIQYWFDLINKTKIK